MALEEVVADIRPIRDAEELFAVQQFKYDIYVEEMGRYGDIADHENRLLIEEDDPSSHVHRIEVDGQLAGTMRLTWGGDEGALHKRLIDQYDLAPFLEHMPIDQLVVAERLMILPQYRGTNLLFQVFEVFMKFVSDRRIQLFFGDCEPHLINTYQALGFRTYTERHVNSTATGYLIPLVIVAEDVDYLRRIGSPLREVVREYVEDARVPDNIDTLVAGGSAVQSERMSEDYMAQITAAAEQAGALRSGLFANMDEDEITTCVGKSLLISCTTGDKIIKKGNVAKNMSMVLAGEFEVLNEGRTIARIGPGEVFGEIAFFLKQPRTADVVATGRGARIISFNDRTIRTLMQSDAKIAAKMLFNISVILCGRLDNMNRLI
jgi:predicted GNAT family N-acyltransferase